MNILNMHVLQCILCASERKCFQIYGTLQITFIIVIINIIINIYEKEPRNPTELCIKDDFYGWVGTWKAALLCLL